MGSAKGRAGYDPFLTWWGRIRTLKDGTMNARRLPVLMLAVCALLSLSGMALAAGTPVAGGEATLIAAGDIASCTSDGDSQTAALIATVPGTVATLGDNAYPLGLPGQFAECYAPTWGAFKDRTRPAPGNHDYAVPGAPGYYGYFGAAAGQPGKGYYSYELGAWHIVAINSNCAAIGGCGNGSPQQRWLRADLAAHPATCTLAYWHHPRFSSGAEHGDDPAMTDIWQTLQDAGADVVLSGHDHDYERFAPQDAAGAADPAHGIREFVVGTGGASYYPFGPREANTEARNNTAFGVLVLTLRPDSYRWRFVPVADGAFTDQGSGACH